MCRNSESDQEPQSAAHGSPPVPGTWAGDGPAFLAACSVRSSGPPLPPGWLGGSEQGRAQCWLQTGCRLTLDRGVARGQGFLQRDFWVCPKEVGVVPGCSARLYLCLKNYAFVLRGT